MSVSGFIVNIYKRLKNKEVNKMFQFKTNIPEFDKENEIFLQAAKLLESLGNDPEMLASEFHHALARANIDIASEDYLKLTGAAIAIETMLKFDAIDNSLKEPTVN
jgi:hypothetical protein